jgi:hypothetical protein
MTPPTIPLRVHSTPRDRDRFPEEDEPLGESLLAMVLARLPAERPAPAMLVLRGDVVEQVELGPILTAAPPHRSRMMAAFAARPDAECAALIGVLPIRLGRSPEPMPAAVVFIEWPDNRWWTSWRLLSEANAPLGDESVIRRAVDGWPKPGGVGGWFALARREQLRLRLERPGQQEGMELVH